MLFIVVFTERPRCGDQNLKRPPSKIIEYSVLMNIFVFFFLFYFFNKNYSAILLAININNCDYYKTE